MDESIKQKAEKKLQSWMSPGKKGDNTVKTAPET